MLFGLFAGEESFDCLVAPSEGCGPGHTVSGVGGELGEPLDSRSAASAASLRSRTARRRRCRCWADVLRRSAQLIMLLLLYYHYVAIVWMRSRVSGSLSLSLSLARHRLSLLLLSRSMFLRAVERQQYFSRLVEKDYTFIL